MTRSPLMYLTTHTIMYSVGSSLSLCLPVPVRCVASFSPFISSSKSLSCTYTHLHTCRLNTVGGRGYRLGGRCDRTAAASAAAGGGWMAATVRNSEAHPLGRRIGRARAFPRHTTAAGSSSLPTRLRRCLQALSLAPPSHCKVITLY